jgi:hypothetical protein
VQEKIVHRLDVLAEGPGIYPSKQFAMLMPGKFQAEVPANWLPRTVSLSARTILEKVRPAPSARSEHGFPALFKAVEAAIVCRRIVEGTPRAGRSGIRSAASDQEQEREAGDQFSHCLFFLRRR